MTIVPESKSGSGVGATASRLVANSSDMTELASIAGTNGASRIVEVARMCTVATER